MNIINDLLENITLLRSKRALVVPNNEADLKKLVKLIRSRKAKLSNKYILTPSNQFILNKPKALQQLQTGGYLPRNDNICIPAKRPSTTRLTKAAKRQRMIETLKRKWEEEVDRIYKSKVERAIKRQRIAAIFEPVNVEYRIIIETDFGNDDIIYHTITGFIRNCAKYKVRGLVQLRGEDYCLNQQYDSKVTDIHFTTQAIPQEAVPIMEQRMFGCVLKYNYLHIDPNESATNECVYEFLITKYKPYIKSLTKEKLMIYFGETCTSNGVCTNQIIEFCNYYNINVYALDLEFKVFYQSNLTNRSHKYPSLVNHHLYPVTDQSIRDSIFATSRSTNSKCVVGYKACENTSNWNSDVEIVLNPKYHEIKDLENKNVVFTDKLNLRELLVYFFNDEQTIYENVKQNGALTRIKYKTVLIFK